MPAGTLCPRCRRPVMAFGRFLREAEPSRTFRCSHCHGELRRHTSVWFLLGAGAVLLALLVGVGTPFVFGRWGAAATTVFVAVATTVGIVALKICGWLFVGWVPAAATGGGVDGGLSSR